MELPRSHWTPQMRSLDERVGGLKQYLLDNAHLSQEEVLAELGISRPTLRSYKQVLGLKTVLEVKTIEVD